MFLLLSIRQSLQEGEKAKGPKNFEQNSLCLKEHLKHI
jgi:hypothetical protein